MNRSPHVLVVDDDRLVLAILVEGLREAGFEISEADNGDDAILLARERNPDIALLDMRMNGMSGMDVARYLRQHTDVPFMFLSAFGDPAIVREATAQGALGYLVKPLELKQIVPALHAALARAQEIQALRRTAAGLPDASPEDPQALEHAIATLSEQLGLSRDAARAQIDAQAAAQGRSSESLARDIVRAQATLAVFRTGIRPR
jgi:two-component system, response regulator PdtaR